MAKNELNIFKKNLTEIIKFKSISTDSKFKPEMLKTANALKILFAKLGFKTRVLKGKTTNLYVFAEYLLGRDRKTILIYGHYDVMPPGDLEKWVGDPFKLTEKNGRLYGRGVIDNKGQFTIHLTAISQLIKAKKLKCNVKFLLEGNEETGNVEIERVIKDNQKLLACDCVLISDGELTDNKPTIEAGFRGGVNLTIKYRTGNGDVHSGLYGGSIPNAAHELSNLISRFYGSDNKVKIPRFYDGADKVSLDELKNNQSFKFSKKKLYELTGIKTLKCEKNIDYFTQTGLRPMLTVSGMLSGYIGEGYNNIVPSYAEARINFRFVTSQKPNKILKVFKEFVKKNTPKYVDFEIDETAAWEALKIDIKSDAVKEAKEILEKSYGEKPVYRYVGGSIPVIGVFRKLLTDDVISIPLANEDCNMHGVNENFKLDLVKKALSFSRSFFANE